MTTIFKDLLGQNLAGYKLVECNFLELEHSLMGYFPAIFSRSRKEAIFVDKDVLEAAKKTLPERRHTTHTVAFLLEPEGKGGFIIEGEHMLKRVRCEVYTKDDLDKHIPIEWAPGLL